MEEMERGIERSQVPQQDERTALRAWGWNLHEMREAAVMEDPVLDESSNIPCLAPTVSGFMPINHPGPSNTAPNDPEHQDAAIKSKSANRPRFPKRQKTQPSTATIAPKPKPKKAAGPKKTRRAKTAAELDCREISQRLPRNKLVSSRDGVLPVKTEFSYGDIPLEQNSELRRTGDRSVEVELQPKSDGGKERNKPSGLATRYQSAYANFQSNTVHQATHPLPPKSDEFEAELDQNDQSHGPKFAIEGQASPNSSVESIQKNLETESPIMARDFGAPPFTQTSSPTLQEKHPQGTIMLDEFDLPDSRSNNLFKADMIRSDDHSEVDEFPMEDGCVEEMVHSMAVPAEKEFLGLDGRLHDFSDDTLYIDEQLENDQSYWPGALPDSDGVGIYDEGPTLVAGDIIDVPSSPQGTSQASCILTHVAGNAHARRTILSEGSEKCFDDNDLDDGLIDLMVDESKGFQVTSPVTPTSRVSPPKLQWLSPKTYTPAKSSHIPVFFTDKPHPVPINSNGGTLPFTRPPFPKAVRDRSPILGLTSRTALRICFRIGEALNAAAVASRTNIDAFIELYARIVSSWREANGGYKQFFLFGDLFTDKPPYLSGAYTFWKGVSVWDNDSKELVGEQGGGKMVRVLGKIKKRGQGQGQGPGVEIVVLSIWEIDWEDVGVAKGIACPEENW